LFSVELACLDQVDDRMVLGMLSSHHLLDFSDKFRARNYHKLFFGLLNRDGFKKIIVNSYHMKKLLKRDFAFHLQWNFLLTFAIDS